MSSLYNRPLPAQGATVRNPSPCTADWMAISMDRTTLSTKRFCWSRLKVRNGNVGAGASWTSPRFRKGTRDRPSATPIHSARRGVNSWMPESLGRFSFLERWMLLLGREKSCAALPLRASEERNHFCGRRHRSVCCGTRGNKRGDVRKKRLQETKMTFFCGRRHRSVSFGLAFFGVDLLV